MRLKTRKVVAEFGPPAPITHWEVEYKYPDAKRWQTLAEVEYISPASARFVREYTSKEDAMRKARELSEGYMQYTTRVIEVVT